MDFSQLRSTTSLLALLITGAVCMQMEVSVSPHDVNVGDDVTISCTVRDFPVDFALMQWRKDTTSGVVVVVATNENLEDAFSGSSYHAIIVEPDDITVVIFKLSISGVMVEDGGTYSCVITTSEETSAQTQLVVHEPPTSLQMIFYNGTQEHIIQGGEEFTFEPLERMRVKCEVSGGNPQPAVSMVIGNEHITSVVEFADDTLIVVDKDMGKERHSYVFSKEIDGIEVEVHKHMNREFKCIGSVPNVKETLKKTFTIGIDGAPPVITCEIDELVALNNEMNVSITCDVIADPAPHEMYVFYKEGPLKDLDVHLLPDGTNNHPNYHNKFRLLTNTDVTGTKRMTLHFDKMEPDMFRTYSFVAQNKIGREMQQVQLKMDPNSILNGSTALALSTSCLLLAIISIILH